MAKKKTLVSFNEFVQEFGNHRQNTGRKEKEEKFYYADPELKKTFYPLVPYKEEEKWICIK